MKSNKNFIFLSKVRKHDFYTDVRFKFTSILISHCKRDITEAVRLGVSETYWGQFNKSILSIVSQKLLSDGDRTDAPTVRYIERQNVTRQKCARVIRYTYEIYILRTLQFNGKRSFGIFFLFCKNFIPSANISPPNNNSRVLSWREILTRKYILMNNNFNFIISIVI